MVKNTDHAIGQPVDVFSCQTFGNAVSAKLFQFERSKLFDRQIAKLFIHLVTQTVVTVLFLGGVRVLFRCMLAECRRDVLDPKRLTCLVAGGGFWRLVAQQRGGLCIKF